MHSEKKGRENEIAVASSITSIQIYLRNNLQLSNHGGKHDVEVICVLIGDVYNVGRYTL